MSLLPDRMRIDGWSDVVCSGCAIAEAHLGQALPGFEHADEVDVAAQRRTRTGCAGHP